MREICTTAVVRRFIATMAQISTTSKGDIATRAAVSVRTLNGRFAAETGQMPKQWPASQGDVQWPVC